MAALAHRFLPGPIEDVRRYGPLVVNRFRAILLRTPARQDPRHRGLYFLESANEGFYFTILGSGRILLLGRWPR